jgi:hypothetical protein
MDRAMNEQQKSNLALREAERAIVKYLRNQPDFFNRHLDLVETLRIPHPCKPALSLLEHQVLLLRQRNTQLRKKLQELMAVARNNAQLVSHLQRLILVLIEARQLQDMLYGIKEVLCKEFDADAMALCLAAQSVEMNLPKEALLSPPAQLLFEPLLSSEQPLCGRLTQEQMQALFGESKPSIASVALIPLRGLDWCGLLAIGSRDDQRFYPGMGTLFLTAMGELISHALGIHLRAFHASCTHPPSTPRFKEQTE